MTAAIESEPPANRALRDLLVDGMNDSHRGLLRQRRADVKLSCDLTLKKKSKRDECD